MAALCALAGQRRGLRLTLIRAWGLIIPNQGLAPECVALIIPNQGISG